MNNLENVSSDVEPFKLKSSSNDFSQKLSSVFGGLNALEKRHEEWQATKGEENLDLLKSDPVDQQDEGVSRQDNFKKPQMQPPRKRHFQSVVPDFKKHPEKWTKYTLSDVPGKDISETGNQNAAYSFLEEMRQRRVQDYSLRNADDDDHVKDFKPVIFGVKSQPVGQAAASDDTETAKKHATAKSGKFVMPECVVGMPKPSKKNPPPKRLTKEASAKSVHLEHLDEDDLDDKGIDEDDSMEEAGTASKAPNASEDPAQAKTKIRTLRQNRCDDD